MEIYANNLMIYQGYEKQLILLRKFPANSKTLRFRFFCTIDMMDPNAIFENIVHLNREKHIGIERTLLNFHHTVNNIYKGEESELSKLSHMIEAIRKVMQAGTYELYRDFADIKTSIADGLEQKLPASDLLQIIIKKIESKIRKLSAQLMFIMTPVYKFVVEKVFLRSTKQTLKETNNIILQFNIDSGTAVLVNMSLIVFLLVLCAYFTINFFDRHLKGVLETGQCYDTKTKVN